MAMNNSVLGPASHRQESNIQIPQFKFKIVRYESRRANNQNAINQLDNNINSVINLNWFTSIIILIQSSIFSRQQMQTISE